MISEQIPSLCKPLEHVVYGRSVEGIPFRGDLKRVSLHAAKFEAYGDNLLLRKSEVVNNFTIHTGEDAVLYQGRAVISNVIDSHHCMSVEVRLEEQFFNQEIFQKPSGDRPSHPLLGNPLRNWQKYSLIQPGFKVALADISTLLYDMRSWLDSVEISLARLPESERQDAHREVVETQGPRVIPALNALFEKYEREAAAAPLEMYPAYRSYTQRILHPLVLSAPFASRTYSKPMGYAGDYEMVNMMLRDPCEGRTLFAKFYNSWLLSQSSSAAHRNRIDYLKNTLIRESMRRMDHPSVRVLTLGCGPAAEMQRFVAENPLSDRMEATLMDFNQETLTFAANKIEEQGMKTGRRPRIRQDCRSITQLLKCAFKREVTGIDEKFDFIYCAGLYDYLSDSTIKALNQALFSMLDESGLFIATNVNENNPNRFSMLHALDWDLYYRSPAEFSRLKPAAVAVDHLLVQTDQSGVNLFLEARKTSESN